MIDTEKFFPFDVPADKDCFCAFVDDFPVLFTADPGVIHVLSLVLMDSESPVKLNVGPRGARPEFRIVDE